MAAIKQIPIRFNIENEDEAKAYDYLQNLDKNIYQSYTKAVTAAVINLFESDKKSESEFNLSPPSSFTTSNNINSVEIVEAVRKEIRDALPELVAATLMKLMQVGGGVANNTILQQKKEDTEPKPQLSDAVWSFLDNY